MRYSLFALAAASVVTAQSSSASWTPAPQITNNPAGATYIATLPEQTKYPVRGHVKAVSGTDGKGVKFSVVLTGLGKEGGPFMYHLHEKPVPADGNCTGTGAHLDPYKRGEVPLCDPARPETCQTGDLSGKFGNFTGDSSIEYLDPFSALTPLSNAYFGNLSVVVHFSNKTRIACANFSSIAGGISGYPSSTLSLNQTTTLLSTGTGSPQTTGYSSFHSPTPTRAPPAQQTTNAAEKLTMAGAGILVGVLALAL
ncbi:superoxide dismutase [Dendryphion nanum]|uniref:superoxide dismutase n=1 Tax=Dendryphion nanum TaxID=256645 RepID=A0A9P9E4L4_9PLEO|nr:superoxide dismutase [Dendryphion nanum]